MKGLHLERWPQYIALGREKGKGQHAETWQIDRRKEINFVENEDILIYRYAS